MISRDQKVASVGQVASDNLNLDPLGALQNLGTTALRTPELCCREGISGQSV